MIASLLALAALQAAAPAPTPPAPPPVAAAVDPARLAAATRLVETMRIDTTLDTVFVQLAPGFAQSVIGILATQPDTKRVIDRLVTAAPGNRDRMIAILSQEFLTAVKRQYPGLKANMAREYAAAFTLGELEAINAFYASGPGAKALALMPQLQARMAAAGQALGRIAGEEAGMRAFRRIEAEMLPEAKASAA